MKSTIKRRHFVLSVAAPALILSLCAGARAQNLLADAGFESGIMVPSGVGGWQSLNGASISQDYAHGGVWSLKAPYFNNSNVGGVQIAAITPGSVVQLSGWGFTPAPINGGLGLLGLIFLDANQSAITMPQFFYEAGRLDAGTPPQTWVFLSGQINAPMNAAYAEVIPSQFGGTPGSVLYFDDIALTTVPEPSVSLVATSAFGLLLAVRSRGKHALR